VTLEHLFDILLGLMLIWLAWRVLATPDLFKAVVLFIVFGLLMALAWARLQAPDIALAEAAIGAGLTGALLLDAVGQMAGRGRGQATPQPNHEQMDEHGRGRASPLPAPGRDGEEDRGET
jgi:energy-converting hydrogenase B subunit D